MGVRGFTLVELLIATLVSLLTIAAGMTLLVNSQNWFQSGADDRLMQETARVALDEIQSNLRNAGYGMEPAYAFDFGVLAAQPMFGIPQGDQARFGGYCLGSPAPCARDSTTGPDEVVFYSRDDIFERDVVSVGANGGALTLKAPLSGNPTALLAGQVLQVMCYGGNNQWMWAYVTVASVDSTGANPVVTLATGSGQPFDFPYQNSLLSQPCFSAGPASVRAFKIDRYHYYIQFVDNQGNTVTWNTAENTGNARPYLMLDQGLSQNGQPVLNPVVADVEDLQLAYVFPLAPAPPTGTQVLGDLGMVGTDVNVATNGNDVGAINLNPQYPPFAIPSFTTSPNDIDLSHTTHHPANIRAVKVAIVVRSPRKDIKVQDQTVYAAFNRPDLPGEVGYHRMLFESTAYTRNLETVLPVFPTYDPNWATYNGSQPQCCQNGNQCGGNCGGG